MFRFLVTQHILREVNATFGGISYLITTHTSVVFVEIDFLETF